MHEMGSSEAAQRAVAERGAKRQALAERREAEQAALAQALRHLFATRDEFTVFDLAHEAGLPVERVEANMDFIDRIAYQLRPA